MVQRGVTVRDLEGGHLSLEGSPSAVLAELLERQKHTLAHDHSLNAIQKDWLAEDIEVVEHELAYRQETGKEH